MATIKLPRTIKATHQAFKSKALGVKDMIEQTFQQIREKEHLNAFVTLQKQESLDMQVQESQSRYDKGQPFIILIDGIPIAVKDNILVKDLQSTAASQILRGLTPQIDATVIKKLKSKGAIIVGKTNMDEFGMGSLGMYGYDKSKIAKNPIDADYIAGGSSSGSAIAVKSGQSVVSLGTDTGGSVSYPAHCCGLYSMKPSYGRLSRFGQILYSSSNDVIGPMANSVQDLETMFDIMQGEDSSDSNCIDFTKINTIRDRKKVVGLKDLIKFEYTLKWI